MERAEKIKKLSEKYIPSSHKEQLEVNLHYYHKTDEEEQPFSNLCAVIKQSSVKLTPEDKQLIDEIGESIWNDGKYWQHRMITKYWKDIV